MALLPVGLLGGLITGAVLWPFFGIAIALAGVPFGSSLTVLLAGLFVMALQKRPKPARKRIVQVSTEPLKAAA
jgi:hypothetical protein